MHQKCFEKKSKYQKCQCWLKTFKKQVKNVRSKILGCNMLYFVAAVLFLLKLRCYHCCLNSIMAGEATSVFLKWVSWFYSELIISDDTASISRC